MSGIITDNVGRAGGLVKAAGAAGWTLATEQASTSGTSLTFGSIPAGVKHIDLIFADLSSSGNDNFLVQLGDASGIETSGYVSAAGGFDSSTHSTPQNNTTGFILNNVTGATMVIAGVVSFWLEDAANFTWISTHTHKYSNTARSHGGGSKSLSAELTQLKILFTGSDTFDSGAVNIQYL